MPRAYFLSFATFGAHPSPLSTLQPPEMGLGKTLQAIALILINAPRGRDYSVGKAARSTTQAEPSEPMKKPSKSAIKKLKLPALHNVLTDAGIPVPTKKDQVVSAVDMVLNDGTITMERFSAAVARPTASFGDSTAQVGTTTLVVAPVSVIGAWQQQIEMHVCPGVLRVALYQGTERRELLAGLDEIDVLIVSYNTLQYDYRNSVISDDRSEQPTKRFKQNSIFNTFFHRVILDEAHTIRNTTSSTSKACTSLKAERRLCLTGTPLQNKPEDVHALLKFLRVDPLGDKTVFRRAIGQPIQEGDDNGLARLRAAMAYVALRRSKNMASFTLPEKQVEIRTVSFAPESKHGQIYSAIFESAKRVFQATMKDGDDDALTYDSVFEILTRLRQACCSGRLVPVERLRRAEQVLASISGKQDMSVEEGKRLLEKLKGALEVDDELPVGVSNGWIVLELVYSRTLSSLLPLIFRNAPFVSNRWTRMLRSSFAPVATSSVARVLRG